MHARYQELYEKECRWEELQTADATLIVTAFGSTSRIARTAVAMARQAGLKVGLLRPISLFPFPKGAYAALSERCKRFLDIELSTGQMIDDVRLSVARDADVFFYGRPPGAGSLPTPEELFEQIKKFY
jgi:2-oxoglutarate ferredoxin oxidoreductase subunit alpha